MTAAKVAQQLAKLEAFDPNKMDFGLGRIQQVFSNLKLAKPKAPIISVAGTNGKGSTARLLHDMYMQAGYKVGLYTSPHLIRVNERFVINGETITDTDLAASLSTVETGQGQNGQTEIHLTYFEVLTVAAVHWFQQSNVDLMILEIGLGGRLDAVNALEPSLSVITNISLDHTEWLGDDLDSIGYEKASIARSNTPLVLGSSDMPSSVYATAEKNAAHVYRPEQDYRLAAVNSELKNQLKLQCLQHQQWQTQLEISANIPVALHRENLAAALMAVKVLTLFSVSEKAVNKAIENWQVAGRCQKLPVPQALAPVYCDVAHNVASAEKLAAFLTNQVAAKHYHFVIGMFADKDTQAVLNCFKELPVSWYCATLDNNRSLSADKLAKQLKYQDNVRQYSSITEAFKQAIQNAAKQDCIVVTGSFEAVGPVTDWLASQVSTKK